MAETPEEAIAVMRQASEVVSDVLPAALAELVGDHLLSNIDAVLRGSTPQMQWVAYEVLALAEQPPGPIEASVYMARGIRPNSWLHEDRFTAFRHAYSYAAAKTHAIPGLSKISAEEAYYVWRIIQHGFEFNERTKNDPRLDVGGFGLPQDAADG